jgi:uncharacterized protein
MDIVYDLLIIATLFLINASFVLLVAGPLILLKPTRRKREWYANRTGLLEPRDAGIPQENIIIETFDGFKLLGWLVPHEGNTRGTIVYLHGVGDCKIGGIPFAQTMHANGFNVVLYDSRQHGESEGYFCTYGFYEKHDVSAVITYLNSRTDFRSGKIGIYGTSMGAAVAIQAAAIDHRIAAVAAEGSFSALRTIFVDYQKRIIKLPWHFLRNMALVQSQRLANFKARLVSPKEDIKRIHIPILIIHGKDDSFIKAEYSQQLYESAHEPKQFLLVDGADHSNVWEAGGRNYAQTVSSFFEKYLAQ